ncbi:hypothetical protein ACOSQ3_028126 [Xanthoceras sorbifolium]
MVYLAFPFYAAICVIIVASSVSDSIDKILDQVMIFTLAFSDFYFILYYFRFRFCSNELMNSVNSITLFIFSTWFQVRFPPTWWVAGILLVYLCLVILIMPVIVPPVVDPPVAEQQVVEPPVAEQPDEEQPLLPTDNVSIELAATSSTSHSTANRHSI